MLSPIELPKDAFTNIKRPRYKADDLIIYLKEIKPDTVDYIIRLVNEDICVTRLDEDGKIKDPEYKYKDWGIFGLGYRPGPSCVVSVFRLNSKHPRYVERLKKVCLHELGNNLDLPHCPDKGCFMTSTAEKDATIDEEGITLCPQCRKKIEP